MLSTASRAMIRKARKRGWAMEPEAKAMLKEVGFDVPASVLASTVRETSRFVLAHGFPLVAKAVSPEILHKTEHGAVITGIGSIEDLDAAVEKLLMLPGCRTVLVEEMVAGLEVIVGAKNDFQFGPVVVLGTGGIGVEMFNDVAIRMAPLEKRDVFSMVDCLQGCSLLKGFRGKSGINIDVLAEMVVQFSEVIMDLENDMESIDLNPVICTLDRCVVADARIMLRA